MFWDASSLNRSCRLHSRVKSENQKQFSHTAAKNRWARTSWRGISLVLFFYLRHCWLLSRCVVWLTVSWHAVPWQLAATMLPAWLQFDRFLKLSVVRLRLPLSAIGKRLCALCFQVVDLPVLMDAGEECFAPTSFCFWKGKCHKFCWVSGCAWELTNRCADLSKWCDRLGALL